MGNRTSSARGGSPGKVVVLSLEGVSREFIARHVSDGLMPNVSALLERGEVREMESVRPPVSLVAWASYMTGLNPGRHGIYGFIDRQPGTTEFFVPNSRNIPQAALWEVLSRAGRRVVVLNVPGTYPPRPVNGILVSCFLAPSLDECTYPPELARFLKGMNYRLDADSGRGKKVAGAFLADLDVTVRKKFQAAVAFVEKEPWDFFHLHIMETDRINHLLWDAYEEGDPVRGEDFLSFYRTLDDLIGEFVARIPESCDLMVVSDHGFCRLRREVYLNRFLEERDWLVLAHRKPRTLADMLPGSKAYSLMPGRVYMNLRGREPDGEILGHDEYHGYREGLAADLLRLGDPETGVPVVQEVLRGEELLGSPEWGDFPLAVSKKIPAPFDLLVLPVDGYDIKGYLDRQTVFGTGLATGMHTADGAFVYMRGREMPQVKPRLLDLYPTILDMLGVPAEEDHEGASLL